MQIAYLLSEQWNREGSKDAKQPKAINREA